MTSRVVLSVLAAALVAQPASAASYDPQMTWRTITTEHFHIHFHQGEEALAEEFSQTVEAVYDTMTDEIGWTPRRRTEVVLVDRTDYANGYAGTIPYNQIVVFATAPTPDSSLALYEDWNELLFTHEFTHILHMDTNHGIVRVARAIVGRIASTNDLSPWWMIEGYATFQETRQSTGGRGRASYPDMLKRTAILEDAFPPLGNLDGFEPYPPSGNLRYLFGQDLIQFIADEVGEDAWTRWIHTYGSSIPYLLALPPVDREHPVLPARRSFDSALVPLYFRWRDHLEAKYTAQAAAIRAEGLTEGRLVSGGEANCYAPAFSPDGDHLVWSCYDLKTGSAIWMSDGEGYAREVLLQDRGATSFTWRSDGQAFVYAGIHLVNQFNTWSDIYLHDLKKDQTIALTGGARARDPDFSPDGSRLLYVTNRAQRNQLEVMTIDQSRSPLTDFQDHTQLSVPRHAPDGRSIAAAVWQEGRTDLWLFDPEGRPMRRLTADAAIDTDPAWSADGRWLLFASDRTGVSNIYAIDTQTEALFQVTNVLTGATRPTMHPDGTRLAFQQYSADGWDVIVMDFLPEQFLARGALPRPIRWDTPLSELTGPRATVAAADMDRWGEGADPLRPPPHLARYRPPTDLLGLQSPPGEGLDTFDDEDVTDAYGEEEDFPFTITPHRYNPLPTLLPRFWAPSVLATTELPGPTFAPFMPTFFQRGLQFQASTGSADPLRHFGWSGWASYRTDAEAGGGGGSVTLNRFLPIYTLAGATRVLPRGRVPLVDPTEPVDAAGELVVDRLTGPTYWERRDEVLAQVSWPYRLRSTLFANYAYTDRSALFDLPRDAWLPEVPLRGQTGAVSAGWRYAWAEPTALAISLEDGRILSVVGSFLAPWLGTRVTEDDGGTAPLTQLQLTAEAREYVVVPWIPNHVVAGRVGAGVTLGGTEYLGSYLLGGAYGDGAFYVTPDGSTMLRGYVFGADIGDMYWTANAEYRFPIWHIHRGVGTIPAYARSLSGAAFVDSGNAFNNPALTGQATTLAELGDAAFSEPLVGVGGELSLSGILLWGVGVTGRVGYAVGLTPHGVRPESTGLPYVQFGGSF